jgi:hypothetical protein
MEDGSGEAPEDMLWDREGLLRYWQLDDELGYEAS